MLKELTVKEALHLLAEKYPEKQKVLFNNEMCELHGVDTASILPFIVRTKKLKFQSVSKINIEAPDEYRYMTQQECLDWVCLHGYKGYQVRYKDGATWFSSGQFSIEPKEMEYRAIQEIDGKIIYGEPQEFIVRVQS